MALNQEELTAIAQKHGFSLEAVTAAAEALQRGRGTMAQFQHADFGGHGQWMSGGMLMVGDMFNHGLKARVAALFEDLTAQPASQNTIPTMKSMQPMKPMEPMKPMKFAESEAWWPSELGQPGSSGGQNGIRYAYFPSHHRLVVEQSGKSRVYDTAEHAIGGFSQAQGGSTELLFHTQSGVFPVSELTEAATK